MEKSVRVNVFLLFVVCLLAWGGFAQVGGSGNPPPPPPWGAHIEDGQGSIVLDGTLFVNGFDASTDAKAHFVRNVAQSLLETDRINIVYRTEAAALDQLAFDAVTEGFFERVKDFLVTDGERYFRIVLATREEKGASDRTERAVPEP